MNRFRYTLAALLPAAALLAAAPAVAADDMARAELKGTEGTVLGVIDLRQTPNGVLFKGALTGLPSGTRGFHVHETGSCDAADGFKSAGGHLTGGAEHGYFVANGPHPGDMPNIDVSEQGTVKIELFNSRLAFSSDEKAALFDEDGSALVIHSGADDYTSQPSGDAGERIACAVIEPS